MIDNWQGFLIISDKAFANSFEVVVIPSTCLRSIDDSCDENILGTIKEKQSRTGKNLIFECDALRNVTGEPVDQEEVAFPFVFLHGRFQQINCNLIRDNGSLLDIVINDGSVRRIRTTTLGS